MNELEVIRRFDEPAKVIPLILDATDIPQDLLPIGPNNETLVLPTEARLAVTDHGVEAWLIAREYDSDDWPKFGDENVPLIKMPIVKSRIIRLTIETKGWHNLVKGKLALVDPFGAVPELTLTFSSSDQNNRGYWIRVFAKLLDSIGVEIEEDHEDSPF
jgi:hypothetical protein